MSMEIKLFKILSLYSEIMHLTFRVYRFFFPLLFVSNPELLYDGLNDRDDILFLLWYSNLFKIMGFFLLMFLCDESVSPSIWF